MAIKTKAYLLSKFETDDKPTQEDFTDLIDTLETHDAVIEHILTETSTVWDDMNNGPSFVFDPREIVTVKHGTSVYLLNAPLGTYGTGGLTTNSSNFISVHIEAFSEDQINRIKDLVYLDNTATFNADVLLFEHGLHTTITYSYNVTPNDDTVTAMSTSQHGSIDISNADGVTHISGDVLTDTSIGNTLTINFIKQDVSNTKNINISSVSTIPQFSGVSSTVDYDTYPVSSIDLSKHIQIGAALTTTVSPSDEYIWFISNADNFNVYDQNDFLQSTGTWGDGISEFYTKPIDIDLANGDTVVAYAYRSRNKKTITNFTYQLK